MTEIPRFSNRVQGNMCITVLIFALLAVGVSLLLAETAYAHQKEEGEWLLSDYVSGALVLTPNPSLPQWKNSRMLNLKGMDHVQMSLMLIHNATFVEFLVKRPLNTTVDQAGVATAFEGAGINGSDEIWAYVAGQVVEPRDPTVVSVYSFDSGELTVVIGRQLISTRDSVINLKVGEPYDDFLKTVIGALEAI